jgi:glycosyltransferase involved in cell wall biosynthesis
MKPFTVIVGVPAYNEEANIAFLLEDILRQRCESFVLKEIVIVSDGSTDETSDIAKRYEFRAVSVRGDGKRKGKATRLNEIFDAARGRADAVVLFDADIALVGDEVLEKMVGAVRSGADLVSSELLALPPKTMTGRAIFASHELKRRMFAEWRRGENIYACHGAARAFSSRLFPILRFKESVGEDAYSYLFAKQRGFRYARVSTAAVRIRVPETLRDHEKQSRRFTDSQALFFREFGRIAVSEEYRYPKSLLVRYFSKFFLIHPFALSWYVGIMLYLRFFSRFREQQGTWSPASSSKVLHS